VRSAAPLLHALERETDEEVQAAILLALGRMGTPDAVKRLIETSEPERALFRRKATTLRVAAVQALGEVRAPEAAAALTALTSDKQGEVRDAATFALAKQARQAGASA
jgi:HEAT repeat protein